MDPVVIIPLSEYNELKAFKEKNTIQITFYNTHNSSFERSTKIGWDYFLDKDIPVHLKQELNFTLKSIEQIITEQRAEAKLLAAEREKQQRVPKWILRIFNPGDIDV